MGCKLLFCECIVRLSLVGVAYGTDYPVPLVENGSTWHSIAVKENI